MGKLKALLLTEGMHGMISQVEGMAKALNADYNHKIVRLSFPWNLIPPKFTPISEIILKDKTYLTENETLDLIISCGRKSVIQPRPGGYFCGYARSSRPDRSDRR